MSDLDQFKDTYISESLELIAEMEELLLALDESDGQVDIDEINAIFRCAHSIKGGAGSFGFNRLINFTHILEFLLDKLRNEEIGINDDIIDALLKSIDVVSALVTAAQNGEELPAGYEDELSKRLESIYETESEEDSSEDEEEAYGIFEGFAVDNSDSSTSGGQIPTDKYLIKFIPKKELLEFGNEPLFIIRELMKYCELKVKVDDSKIPDLENIEPIDCYLSWEIEAETTSTLEKVFEAFEFVEDECDLSIERIAKSDDDYQFSDEDENAYGLFSEEEVNDDNLGDYNTEEAYGLFFDDDEDKNSQSNQKVEEEKSKSTKASQAQSKNQPQSSQPQSYQPQSSKSQNSQAQNSTSPAAKSSAISSIRVDLNKVDKMVNMVGEIVITQAMIEQKMKDIPQEYVQSVLSGVQELSRHTRDLQESVMAVRMQPVKSIFSRLPRIVRDVTKSLNKKVKLEMKGESTEIDKTVIEQLSDPLTHMIRNSLDHGIETPEERLEAGKPEEGTINLSADNSGGRIIIEISDDGAGINRERVYNKAIEKGLIPPDTNLSNEEIDQLIFMPGFSTAEAVTDVSGRGVGMDVVKKNIKNLGGDIDMINKPGEGSIFQISLPLTLAILDGMVIRVSQEKYIIPINNILETMQINSSEVERVKSGEKVIPVRGEFIPILSLSEIFNIKSQQTEENDKILVVLVEAARKRFGIIVSELLGQQQVVIKNLEENSDPVEGVSGATILGDGNVSLILDVAQIHKMNFSKFDKDKVAA